MGSGRETRTFVKAALATGKLKPAQLSNALGAAEKAKKPEIATVLKDAGAKPRAPANFQVAPETLASYAGRYQGGRGGTEMEIAVKVENGKLIAASPGGPLTLAAIDTTHFRGVEFDQVEVEFVPGGMKLIQGGNTIDFKRMEAK
jgi:hypothetical protein